MNEKCPINSELCIKACACWSPLHPSYIVPTHNIRQSVLSSGNLGCTLQSVKGWSTGVGEGRQRHCHTTVSWSLHCSSSSPSSSSSCSFFFFSRLRQKPFRPQKQAQVKGMAYLMHRIHVKFIVSAEILHFSRFPSFFVVQPHINQLPNAYLIKWNTLSPAVSSATILFFSSLKPQP